MQTPMLMQEDDSNVDTVPSLDLPSPRTPIYSASSSAARPALSTSSACAATTPQSITPVSPSADRPASLEHDRVGDFDADANVDASSSAARPAWSTSSASPIERPSPTHWETVLGDGRNLRRARTGSGTCPSSALVPRRWSALSTDRRSQSAYDVGTRTSSSAGASGNVPRYPKTGPLILPSENYENALGARRYGSREKALRAQERRQNADVFENGGCARIVVVQNVAPSTLPNPSWKAWRCPHTKHIWFSNNETQEYFFRHTGGSWPEAREDGTEPPWMVYRTEASDGTVHRWWWNEQAKDWFIENWWEWNKPQNAEAQNASGWV